MFKFLCENVMTARNLSPLCAVCIMVVLAVPSAASSPDEDGPPGPRAAETAEARSTQTDAIRVVYDPKTGEIISVPFRESEALPAPLAKALTRSTEGLQVFDLDNGGGGVHLNGRYQHVLMVRVKPDGSLETVCTNHAHGAEDFFKGTMTGAEPAPRDK